MYNPESHKAEEFINHEEILSTIEYADKNKSNAELIDEIIKKAKNEKGLTHKEAAVLLACNIKEKNDEIKNPTIYTGDYSSMFRFDLDKRINPSVGQNLYFLS